jgi:hypothetical protein
MTSALPPAYKVRSFSVRPTVLKKTNSIKFLIYMSNMIFRSVAP